MTDILPADGEHYNAYGRAEGRSYAAPSDPGDFNEAQYLLNKPGRGPGGI